MVAKLEDNEGFALSNSSRIGDVIKSDDRIFAMPEEQSVSPSSV